MKIKAKKIVTGKWKENCYIVYDELSNAVIIDPGNNSEQIIDVIELLELKPKAIFNTHSHFDHIGGVQPLKEYFSIPFYLHPCDVKLLKQANFYRSVFGEEHEIKIPQVDFFLVEESYSVGQMNILVYETPGHTKGSVCFLIYGNLFCGDLILKNKIGRTDLPGGNKEALIKSLIKISKFPSSTILCPGHGVLTSLDSEIRDNKSFLNLIGQYEN